MELSEIANTTVEMWILVNSKLTARSQQDADPVIKAQIFSESMKLHMTNIINEAKGGGKPSEKQTDARQASQKQLDYIKDLGGDPTTVSTSVEASKYIEDLRRK